MGNLRKYRIDIFKIPFGEHEYIFDFDDEFFTNFENAPVTSGSGKIQVSLSKSETFIELSFSIQGKVGLICDRSLDQYDHLLDIHQRLMIKFGDEEGELSSDVIVIPWKTESIDVGQHIYEFIGLDIPMKRLHPRYQNEADHNPGGEPSTFFYSSAPTSEGETEFEAGLDPRWEKLKELKNKEAQK